jgi:hypothetical protein
MAGSTGDASSERPRYTILLDKSSGYGRNSARGLKREDAGAVPAASTIASAVASRLLAGDGFTGRRLALMGAKQDRLRGERRNAIRLGWPLDAAKLTNVNDNDLVSDQRMAA